METPWDRPTQAQVARRELKDPCDSVPCPLTQDMPKPHPDRDTGVRGKTSLRGPLTTGRDKEETPPPTPHVPGTSSKVDRLLRNKTRKGLNYPSQDPTPTPTK